MNLGTRGAQIAPLCLSIRGVHLILPLPSSPLDQSFLSIVSMGGGKELGGGGG